MTTYFDIAYLSLLPVALFAYFVGGAVKGTLGLGMPITVVSLMSLVSDARTAVLLVLFPILITNLWQCHNSGKFYAVCRQYWRLGLCMTITLLTTSFLAVELSVSIVSLSVGVAVILFACINLCSTALTIPDRLDTCAQCVAGCVTGVLGGISGLVVVPLVLYFSARKLDKDTFVESICPFFLLGGCLLITSYTSNGLFTPELALLSLLLVIPAVLGVIIGTRLRKTIPNEQFRRFVLYLFLLMGINMVFHSLVN